jgi:hyperosmotically inducible protein
MTINSLTSGAFALAFLVLGCTNRDETVKVADKPAPDNTATNTRDREGSTKVPADQAENDTDLGITQTIRKQLVGQDVLSFNAENVKIVTSGGVVTLRGPVETVAERDFIDAKARATAGVQRVDNQLEVAGK